MNGELLVVSVHLWPAGVTLHSFHWFFLHLVHSFLCFSSSIKEKVMIKKKKLYLVPNLLEFIDILHTNWAEHLLPPLNPSTISWESHHQFCVYSFLCHPPYNFTCTSSNRVWKIIQLQPDSWLPSFVATSQLSEDWISTFWKALLHRLAYQWRRKMRARDGAAQVLPLCNCVRS